MPSDNEQLEPLLARLEELLARTQGGDAIDVTLKAAPRISAATSLREHEIVRRFRQEVTDGLIRLDTANQLLGLVRTILDAAVAS
jgi:hypothetical protein